MKKRLVVLSDLWGFPKAQWIKLYQDHLSTNYDFHFYDVCQLGEVDLSIYDQEAIHSQFVDFGIKTAVEQLLVLEEGPLDLLAFSVGGTIGWQANLRGLEVDRFYGVSATRLRYETQRPTSQIKLYYGEQDTFRPPQAWLQQMEVDYSLFKNEEHQLYKQPQYSKQICSELLAR